MQAGDDAADGAAEDCGASAIACRLARAGEPPAGRSPSADLLHAACAQLSKWRFPVPPLCNLLERHALDVRRTFDGHRCDDALPLPFLAGSRSSRPPRSPSAPSARCKQLRTFRYPCRPRRGGADPRSRRSVGRWRAQAPPPPLGRAPCSRRLRPRRRRSTAICAPGISGYCARALLRASHAGPSRFFPSRPARTASSTARPRCSLRPCIRPTSCGPILARAA